MHYFANIMTLEALKIEYKRLCKIHHPDLGGQVEVMQAINAQYSAMLANVDLGKSTVEIEESIMNIIRAASVLHGVRVELCGNWVWLTGETFTWKEQIKSLGCFFSAKKVAWYWRPADYKRKGKGLPSLEAVRAKYGSRVFESQKQESLA